MKYKVLSPEVEERCTREYLLATNDFPFSHSRDEQCERMYEWARDNLGIILEEEQ